MVPGGNDSSTTDEHDLIGMASISCSIHSDFISAGEGCVKGTAVALLALSATNA